MKRIFIISVFLFLALPVHAALFRSAEPKKESDPQQNRQVLMQLYNQIQSLQDEVRQLRNQVEIQQNQMERLQTRLRSVTEDLDRRVQGLERGGVATTKNLPTGNSVPAVPPSSSTGNSQAEYEAAFQLMKQGDYKRAAQAFKDFLQKYPNGPLAGNAQYWIGETSYLVRNFHQAVEDFDKVIRQYPNSRKVPDAMLKKGYSYYELHDYKKAREILNEIGFRYPNTLVSRSAQSRLALMTKEGH